MANNYHIVTAPVSEDTKAFERKVSNLLKKGWSLSGPLQYLKQPNYHYLFAQIMVKDGTNTFTDYTIVTSDALEDLYVVIDEASKAGFRELGRGTRDVIKLKVRDLYYQFMVK